MRFVELNIASRDRVRLVVGVETVNAKVKAKKDAVFSKLAGWKTVE